MFSIKTANFTFQKRRFQWHISRVTGRPSREAEPQIFNTKQTR
nr:MAG TPA: hypothetical protein [Caudoviricetes sp.]